MSKEITFSFGRLNPPTTGHGKLLDALASVSSGEYRMYLSKSHDSKKNPLTFSDKLKYVKQMFPKHSSNIMTDKNINNVFDILVHIYKGGYKNVTMVVGADRVNEFELLMKKYNDVKARHGYYNFNTITVKSAGRRDPDAEGVVGMSASKMRLAAAANDYDNFKKGIPTSFKGGESLMNDVRSGMGISEDIYDFIANDSLMLSEYFDCLDSYSVIEQTPDELYKFIISEELYKYNSYLVEMSTKIKNLNELDKIGEKICR